MSLTREHLHSILFAHYVSNSKQPNDVCFEQATEAVNFYMGKVSEVDQQISVKDAAKNAEDETKEAAHIEHHMVSRSNFIKLFAGHPIGHDFEKEFPRQRMLAEELLIAERVEQICVHKHDSLSDLNKLLEDPDYLIDSAKFCISDFDGEHPSFFSQQTAFKIAEKPLAERLIIAASFLCAQAQVILDHDLVSASKTIDKYYDANTGNMKFGIDEWKSKINKV